MPTPPRRLNLVDGMILVVASALGLLLARQYLRDSYPDFARRVDATPTRLVFVNWYVAEIARVVLMWLAVASPALLAIRLRRPRPRVARVFRQFGTLASLAGTLIVLGGGLIWAIAILVQNSQIPEGMTMTSRDYYYFYELTFARIISVTGPAVAVGWLALSLAQCGSTERGVIDRSGRFLGCAWIWAFVALEWTEMAHGVWLARDIIQFEPTLDRIHIENEKEWKRLEESKRQAFEDTRIELQELLNGQDQERIKSYIKKCIEANENQRRTFEANPRRKPGDPYALPDPPEPLPISTEPTPAP